MGIDTLAERKLSAYEAEQVQIWHLEVAAAQSTV